MLAILGSSRSDGKTSKALFYVMGRRKGWDYLDLSDFLICLYDYEACYPEEDDFMAVVDKMLKHDKIVFATPVYWYAMSAQMKTFFDRLSDLITMHKKTGRALAGKQVLVLVTGTDENLPEGFDVPFCRTFDYFNMKFSDLAYVYTGDDADRQRKSLLNAKRFFQAFEKGVSHA